MNAQLKPLDVFAVSRPAYDNKHVAQGALWMRDNDAALKSYYVALGGKLPQPADNHITGNSRANKFMGFMLVQWDRERMAL